MELPADISEKDRQGILRSIDRCTVKKVIQTGPEFVIEEVESIDADAQALLMPSLASENSTFIPGKDLPLEETIANMSAILAGLSMKIEIASWRNIVPNVWSLHILDAQSPMCFTNGKGSTKESALASALGEFIERLNCNFFYNDQFWGEDIANAEFVHYPDENTEWGQLTILELKLLIYVALQQFEEAKDLVEQFLQFNTNTVERGLFYQCMNVVLEVILDDEMELDDYEHNFRRMFGDARMDAVLGSIEGTVRFYGLTETNMQLEGLDRHLRLIDSYKKLHAARAKFVAQQ